MTISAQSRRVAAVTAGLVFFVATSAAAQPVRVPLDHETTVAGIGVACTGIGQTKNDPKWQAYPVLVEFAGPGGELLADESMALSDASGGAGADRGLRRSVDPAQAAAGQDLPGGRSSGRQNGERNGQGAEAWSGPLRVDLPSVRRPARIRRVCGGHHLGQDQSISACRPTMTLG